MACVVIGNETFTLLVDERCVVRSLVLSATGEECLAAGEEIALFSVTQERPYNNEVKLAHPNKRTTWQGSSLRREGDLLLVSFDVVPVRAVIRVREEPDYVTFRLERFDCPPDAYEGLCMDTPPVEALRLCQLPVRKRANFGEWLNVVWDDRAAVNVLAVSPHAMIDQEERPSCRVLTADAVRGIRLEGCEAALIACPPAGLLPAIARLEWDYGLPDGVGSRRHPLINASVYWTNDICPANAREHIARAKQGGFRLMLIYVPALFQSERGYWRNGDYDFNSAYPGGLEDFRQVLAQVREAGIEPGLHFLHTHIGMGSRYVTPHADPRLGKKRRFTLAMPLNAGDECLFVEEDPAGSPMHPSCRVLQLGGELVGYEGYSSGSRPFCFTGIQRGLYGTEPEEHPAGQVGSVLDISEFGATSCYIDQETGLQDEIAEKLARVYAAGFRFCYMDGSEGTNVPFAYHVPNAQYRVYRALPEAPLFTEGAAKAHFSWHFQAGGNAFDIFPPKVFKQMIDRFPMEEAPRMRQDFTRLDFGWWGFWPPSEDSAGTQPDQYEYGTSRAAAWDCPATVQASLARFDAHPRTDDILEVMRRWEDVRATGWLTAERKQLLRAPGKEHALLIAEDGGYELVEIARLEAPERISAFAFSREGEQWALFWHERGEGTLLLPVPADRLSLKKDPGGEAIPVLPGTEGWTRVPAAGRRCLRVDASAGVLRRAFANAKLV